MAQPSLEPNADSPRPILLYTLNEKWQRSELSHHDVSLPSQTARYLYFYKAKVNPLGSLKGRDCHHADSHAGRFLSEALAHGKQLNKALWPLA